MTTDVLLGPHRLDFTSIEAVIPRIVPGVYVLGHINYSNVFYLNAIGRCDVDLRTGLQGLIGSGAYFKYQVAPTSRAAFEHECKLFHQFRSNVAMHPVRSESKDWTCPYCRVARDDRRATG